MTDATVPPAAARAPLSPGAARRRILMRRLWRHRSFRLGAVILLVIVLMALAAPLLSNGEPTKMNLRARFAPPSADFIFGADNFGRDIFTRVLYGARISLWIGFASAMLAAAGGALVGLASAWYRRLDGVIMRIMDALLAFPAILLAIGINAALGPQVSSVIIALAAAYVPRMARIVRAAALVVRELDYVDAARVSGASAGRIIFRHILPNCLAPLIVSLTFVFAYAILAEAALSFLGIGPPPPQPSWGNIIAEGRDYSVEAWWIMLFPGLAISLAALGTNLLGDGLRDVLDPRLKIEA
ncbi:ABC transporter permease subunit [Pseudooceanicola sp. 216_PA32_1]|uniref:ABC transporter permease subunit n=1 Tax=Pseudooceanicola pacificus TaxID=2676438 RepID=A0A844W5N6_9RHOB|nr:ABC transporter permease [Pseudooceanicola pacificus]MWB78385.1 ABC transporter permease subunit [Pseudooceanicola pacificus]